MILNPLHYFYLEGKLMTELSTVKGTHNNMFSVGSDSDCGLNSMLHCMITK